HCTSTGSRKSQGSRCGPRARCHRQYHCTCSRQECRCMLRSRSTRDLGTRLRHHTTPIHRWKRWRCRLCISPDQPEWHWRRYHCPRALTRLSRVTTKARERSVRIKGNGICYFSLELPPALLSE